jgi:hypothetical protein
MSGTTAPVLAAPSKGKRVRRWAAGLAAAFVALSLLPSAAASADDPVVDDPRVGLDPGYFPYSDVAENIRLLENTPRAEPFDAPPNDFGFVNSDLAFTGKHAIVGNFNGFQVYDVSNPAAPVRTGAFVCPGGQGDVSVYGDLLFMSVEETRARVDCGSQGVSEPVSPERFRGVRIFDISDIDNPVQLPGVQLCRGSHTHTLVTKPGSRRNVYIYNSGTAGVRPAAELAGCRDAELTKEPVTTGNPTLWRIDVIKVPLRAPEKAAVVSQPRIFRDPATGAFNGLQNTLPGEEHPSGTPYSPLPNTNTCHDITSYPALGIAAGACQGNGILLDIRNPVKPRRIDAVADPNFSYWHSATLSNDGSTVVFTDEWGGGTSARCRATDKLEWGADAIYKVDRRRQMHFASYYKMPAVQTEQENCVAHNSSLVPVPGRDIMVQAWYQGGLSMFDFSKPRHPVEIAYYDRGPIDEPEPGQLNLGGLWSTYWYNGNVFGSEIARGFDSFKLLRSEHLSGNEIRAAKEVRQRQFNAQHQTPIRWRPSFNVVGSYFDQAVRSRALSGWKRHKVERLIEHAEELHGRGRDTAAAHKLEKASKHLSRSGDQGDLRDALRALADRLDRSPR